MSKPHGYFCLFTIIRGNAWTMVTGTDFRASQSRGWEDIPRDNLCLYTAASRTVCPLQAQDEAPTSDKATQGHKGHKHPQLCVHTWKLLPITARNSMTIRNLPKPYAQLYILQTLIYASWQKGAMENANKLIRQYFPKGTDFRNVSDNEVLQVQRKLNQRPRAKINFSSPLKESYGMIS